MWKIADVSETARGLEVRFVKIGQYDEVVDERIGIFNRWVNVTRNSEPDPIQQGRP